MATIYQYKYDKLISWGFLPFEAREFARQYMMGQLRTLPYASTMTRWRRLYISNLRSRGYTDDQIRMAILRLYISKDWLIDGRPDPWKLIKAFRRKAIDEGEYILPKRKGSHHKALGVSKGDVEAQKRRRRERKSFLQKYAEYRGKE